MIEMLEKIGGWPVVKGDEWNSDDWEWMNTNRDMSNGGLEDSLLFSLTILTDQKNSSKRVLDVDKILIISQFHKLFIYL